MLAHAKPWRRELADVLGAAFRIEDALAILALEVMVMVRLDSESHNEDRHRSGRFRQLGLRRGAHGILLNDPHGGWFSTTAECGSGLSSAICPPGTPGYCEVTPHTIFDVSNGIPIAPRTALTLGIQNLLDDRYYVTLFNAQGNHYAAPRTFTLGLQLGNP